MCCRTTLIGQRGCDVRVLPIPPERSEMCGEFCSELYHTPSYPLNRMNYSLHFALLFLSVGSLYQTTSAVLMEKLARRKLCADEECSYALSMAMAEDDFIAPDCRFINIKKGQMIYVYSKLTPAEGAGVFWSGSVYSERYVDQMGIIGYFPSNLARETHTFKKETVDIPTTDMDFYCV